jgi:hypothetical protein
MTTSPYPSRSAAAANPTTALSRTATHTVIAVSSRTRLAADGFVAVRGAIPAVVGPDGGLRVDLRRHGRALLLLFLLSDVGPDDAPTRIRVGSHHDVPPFLADGGDAGREWFGLCGDVVPASAGRPVALADRRAGDVFCCHPFLVHAAQPHHGTRPRLMAQPPLEPVGALDLDEDPPTPVAAPVRAALVG